jgi:hypothetical protein
MLPAIILLASPWLPLPSPPSALGAPPPVLTLSFPSEAKLTTATLPPYYPPHGSLGICSPLKTPRTLLLLLQLCQRSCSSFQLPLLWSGSLEGKHSGPRRGCVCVWGVGGVNTGCFVLFVLPIIYLFTPQNIFFLMYFKVNFKHQCSQHSHCWYIWIFLFLLR